MIGIEKVWKAVTGRDERAPSLSATAPEPRGREVAEAPLPDPMWDFDDEPAGETRSAERFVPLRTATWLATGDGRRCAARIINISRTGVAVEADFKSFRASEVVTAGSRPVTPGRRIALGAVFLFKKPLDPRLCEPNIIL